MFHNVGKYDRIVRVIIALTLAGLYFLKVWPEYSNWLLIAAGVMAMSAIRSCCPIYALLGFGTCGVKREKQEDVPRIKTQKLKI